jgi:acetylornithine deacetylase ArgE
MVFDPVGILAELVAIPSVNPMGRKDADSAKNESRLTDHLEHRFAEIGLVTWRQTVASGRENLFARLDGSLPPDQGGGLLLLDAHQDTVPVEGMTIDPWGAVVHEGRLYGRGACDIKGGMAAMISAVARLAAERPPQFPTVLLACTVDEEYHLAGARALVSAWRDEAGNLLRLPDAALVAEPTGLDVIVAHKGIVRWRCHARGRAAHSSHPELGDNAILRMARVIAKIEYFAREVLATSTAHPLCGPCTLTVGTIQGGSSINIVPEHCSAEIEIRVPPGGDLLRTRQDLLEHLDQQLPCDAPLLQHDAPYMEGPSLSDSTNSDLAGRLAAIIQEVHGPCRRRGVPFATNAAFYGSLGLPAVVFGPGAIEQAHTADEWVPIDEVRHASEIIYRFVRNWRVR